MRLIHYSIFLLLFLAFSGSAIFHSPQSSECLAVITEIRGKAIYREAGMSQFKKATWGIRLFNGDQVATDDKSAIKLLYPGNNIITVGPNSVFTISGAAMPATGMAGNVKTISASIGMDFSSLAFKRAENKDVGALAGVRSGDFEQPIHLEFPYCTTIRSNRPAFSWIPKTLHDSYTVNLYGSNGLLWSKKVAGNSMRYPEDEKGLESGESYFWNVEGEDILDTDKSSSHKFTVLTTERMAEVEGKESSVRNTFSDDPESSSLHSVLGALFIDEGLLQDAIHEFTIIAAMNADAPLPHEILGSLFSEVGEKDKAIEELKTALALTNSQGN